MKKVFISGDSGTNYGTIGEDAKFKGLKVGDVVAYTHGGSLRSGMVFRNTWNNTITHGIMGRLSTPLKEEITGDFKVIVPHTIITGDILKEFASHINIVIKTAKKMTVAEVEQELGYTVEIVSE